MLSAGMSRPERLLHYHANSCSQSHLLYSLFRCSLYGRAFCSIKSGGQIWPVLRKPNSFWKVLDSCQEVLPQTRIHHLPTLASLSL